jgi:hypothetical protein
MGLSPICGNCDRSYALRDAVAARLLHRVSAPARFHHPAHAAEWSDLDLDADFAPMGMLLAGFTSRDGIKSYLADRLIGVFAEKL